MIKLPRLAFSWLGAEWKTVLENADNQSLDNIQRQAELF